jgi:aminoglycoside phosphotransferase (APT) family kinase protein
MLVPRTRARSVGLRALETLTGWRPGRLEKAAPRYALVASRSVTGVASTLFQLGRPPSETMCAIMLTGGDGDWSRVTLLPFEAETDEPARVLKAARRPAFGPSVDREQRALAEVRAVLDPGLRDTVPEPLGTHVWNGAVVGVESFVGGRSMGISLADHRAGWEEKRRDLRDAAGWLADIHSRTVASRDPWSRSSREIVDAPLRRYASLVGLGDPEARLFEEIRRASEDLGGTTFPRVRWHRDFQPTNVFRDGDAIRVVDWEVSTEGPALVDLIYFLIHWAWRASGARSERVRQDVFRELFLTGEGRAAEAAGEEIARYRDRLGIDARYVPVFVLVTLVQLALDRVDRLRSLAPPDSNDPGVQPYAGYVRLLAEDR